ncbi:MAG: hypothetical protein ACI837_000333 [Crocinitomicaceae bacterium]|jgi:hypothetical protein
MKLFIKKVLGFALIPLLVLFGLIIILISQQKSAENKFELDANVSTLFMGDSHVQQAINDSLLVESKNLGVDSESFFFTYHKLKSYLTANKQIKKVNLGFSYHSLSSYFDAYISGEYSRTVSLRYFNDLPASDRMTCILWNSDNISSYLKELIFLGDGSSKSVTVGYRNTFTKSKAKKSSMDKRIKFQFYSDGQVNGFSSINLEYLDLIIALCKEKDIELVLINTPMHPYYQDKIPAEFIRKYQEIVAMNNLEIIDFASFTLDDDCFIPDGDHVSVEGAKRVAEYLLNKEPR